MPPIERIVAATEFSSCSQEAVDFAVDLARAFQAELTLVHVWHIAPMVAVGAAWTGADLISPVEESAEIQLGAELARTSGLGVSASAELRAGAAWEQILEVAKEKNADLIVVGSHGRTGAAHLLLGSVADQIVRSSAVPVLVVRDRARSAHRDAHGPSTAT